MVADHIGKMLSAPLIASFTAYYVDRFEGVKWVLALDTDLSSRTIIRSLSSKKMNAKDCGLKPLT